LVQRLGNRFFSQGNILPQQAGRAPLYPFDQVMNAELRINLYQQVHMIRPDLHLDDLAGVSTATSLSTSFSRMSTPSTSTCLWYLGHQTTGYLNE